MKKDEILKVVRANSGSVLSFPSRGSWGSSSYRGNCSGYVIGWLIDKYNVSYLAEMYAGSGTGYDVAQDMGIQYIGADLNPKPVRNGILCCNALTDEIPEEFTQADFVFQHMPYPEIGISYAGSMYPDPTGLLKAQDIGQMDFSRGMAANNKVTMKLYTAMRPGAKMGILCGNVRRNGQYHDMMLSLALPGNVIQNVIKMQHNCVSNGRTYANHNFVPITHENLVILQKPMENAIYIAYVIPKKEGMDIRDSVNATWREVIASVMYDMKKSKVHYKEIYDCIKGHEKAKNNQFALEKIRQVLRKYPKSFSVCGDGYYSLAA